jgi:eukaryotic-like serine/threonine-protein kinase
MHEASRFPRPFGKYLLLRQIAVGGMAEVYLARSSGPAGFEKECVIKRILPALALDAQFVQMFLDEARIAARLTHPNIVQMYDLGEIGAHDYFLAMEHVHGVDLQQILEAERARGGRIPLAIALRLCSSVAAGLFHAHNATSARGEPLGLVHRDVTPSNVMVSFDGATKILDFGIAKAAAKATRTEVGVVKGKIPYMSPEQIQGETIDWRSDIFSLGTVLYELSTGQKPFDGANTATLSLQILHDDLKPPGLLVDRYPEALTQIVQRAMAKRPNDRFQSARELEDALDELLAQSGVRCGAHELGAYVEELFPGRRELLHDSAAVVLPVEFTDPTMPMHVGSQPRPQPELSGKHTGPSGPVEGPDLSMRMGNDVPADVRRNLGGGGSGVKFIVLLLIVGVAAAFWYLRQRMHTNPPANAVAPPANTVTPPSNAATPDKPKVEPIVDKQELPVPKVEPIVEKPATPVVAKPEKHHDKPKPKPQPKPDKPKALPRLPTPPPTDDAP